VLRDSLSDFSIKRPSVTLALETCLLSPMNEGLSFFEFRRDQWSVVTVGVGGDLLTFRLPAAYQNQWALTFKDSKPALSVPPF